MVQKDKSKKNVTATQELSLALAEKLISKIVVIKGKPCLRGQEDSPIEMLAEGPCGPKPVLGVDYPAPKDGVTPVKGRDYRDGIDAVGKRGLRGEKGKTPKVGIDFQQPKNGRPGEPGKCIFPEMKWQGTKLVVGDLPPVDLQGLPGVGLKGESVKGEPGVGKTGKAGDPGIMPEEVLSILSRLEALEAK